jgi:hypothetical protein
MRHRSFAAVLALAMLAVRPAAAQNLITEGDWEGFAMRDADNKLDRCVLYNRTVQALTASPYDMLGVTRDPAGRIGLLVFFEPRMLTRGETTMRLSFDDRPPVSMPAIVLSDFHVEVAALDAATLAALRAAKAMEATVADHVIRFDLAAPGAVLERLDACVKMYGPKS